MGELVKLVELVFLEYGVVGEVGCDLVRSCGEEVCWLAEWVGVIRLSGPANEGVARACSRGCGHDNGFAAVDIVSSGVVYRAVSHPSDGKGGRVWLWIRIRVRGVASDVRDGHVASDFADGETSEGLVVGIGGACDLEVGFGRVGAVVVGEVSDEAVGEGVAVSWPHGGSGVFGDCVGGDAIVKENLYCQLWVVDEWVTVALVVLRTIVAHHLGE